MIPVKPEARASNPIVVAGAGAAGLSCALSAATAGARVVLLEKTTTLGGTVCQALIHTLGGLFDDQGALLNGGLPAELVDRLGRASPVTHRRRIGKAWVLDVDPTIYGRVVTEWIKATPTIEVIHRASVTGLSVRNGHIERVDISHDSVFRTLNPLALVDTTGDADIVRLANPDCVAEGEALAGVILRLRGVGANALQFPKNVALMREIRKAAEDHGLPRECSTLWLDAGVYPDEAYVKFNVKLDNYDADALQATGRKLLIFLQAISDFGEAFIDAHGQLGIRDGGRIRGEHCLTEADIKSGRHFADAACRACWPIEHWHPDQGISVEYLPAGHTYDIPLRSLKVAGFTNLWAAGKCLSAEPRAQSSARVVGTCWAMGAAIGQYLSGN